jgi:general secretion pathway protein H
LRRDKDHKGDHGFTLLELILVMLLASLILGLTTVFFSNTIPSARLGAAGRELSAFIRQTRYLAQNRGEDLILTIDIDHNMYGIEGVRVRTIPAGIAIRVVDAFYGEIRNGTYPILFRATGGVESGTLVLSYRKKAVYINMDPIMGAVKVQQ